MLKYLVDTGQQRDVVLLYVSSNAQEFAYIDVLQAAVACGLRTVYILDTKPENVPAGWQWELGRVTPEILRRWVPDFAERICYISGPNGMVLGTKQLLLEHGCKRRAIKTDYFAGY